MMIFLSNSQITLWLAIFASVLSACLTLGFIIAHEGSKSQRFTTDGEIFAFSITMTTVTFVIPPFVIFAFFMTDFARNGWSVSLPDKGKYTE